MNLLDTIASYQLVLQGATTVFARGEARTWLNEELEKLFKIGRKATNAAAADYLAQAIEICFNDDGFVIHPDEDGADDFADPLGSAVNLAKTKAAPAPPAAPIVSPAAPLPIAALADVRPKPPIARDKEIADAKATAAALQAQADRQRRRALLADDGLMSMDSGSVNFDDGFLTL